MKINEVEKISGLSAKAIRLYESKGLISPIRQENSYREYDESTIENLKEIKLYRKLGVRISDIKLIKDGVISTAEVLNQRLSDLKKEEDSVKNQYLVLNKIKDLISLGSEKLNHDELLSVFENSNEIDESSEDKRFHEGISSKILIVGIDIGTTTISASVVNGENGTVVDVYTIANNTFIMSANEFEHIQDVSAIVKRATDLINSILNSYPNVKCIGVTGQMHGVVYIDADGKAISPLYTWQDRRGEIQYKDNMTYSEYVSKMTQYEVATGFGIVTHFYNQVNGLLPLGVSKMCTIMDYLTIRLTGNKTPLTHISNAASFGCFDIKNRVIYVDILKKIGVDKEIIPQVTDKFEMIGKYKNIPVSVALGDNQASFLGSVAEPKFSVLVNIGTGSQLSIMIEKPISSNLEVRPYISNQYLHVGSSLCGGKAYAVLESFFRSIAVSAGAPDKPLYNMMNQLAQRASHLDNQLEVSTLFCGTRVQSTIKGSIKNISDDNLTAEKVVYGTLRGIAEELHGFYKEIESFLDVKPKYIVASGNGVRRNKAMQEILAKIFGLAIFIPEHSEEAAFGAALFALISLEGLSKIEKISKFIKYR